MITNITKEYNDMARVTRLSRMYKLMKLTRLFRILKILKQKAQIVKQAQEIFKISVGFERLFYFVISFFLICHIVSCLWILMAQLSSDNDSYLSTWMEPYQE